MLGDLIFRLRTLFQRNAAEEQLDDELRFHFENEVEKLVAHGRTRPEAVREAKLALGGIAQIKEECRQARGVDLVETTLQDFVYAIRRMWQSPGFTVTALFTLGLGMAAVSTVFTLANTLFFRKLPVYRPDRLVTVQATRRHAQLPGWVSFRDYAHFRDQSKTLEGLAAVYPTAPFFVTVNGRSQEINGAVVSANFFPLLGLRPALGRFFRRDEDAVPNRDAVAVVSFEFWRNWLGQSADISGSTLKLNGVAFTIIGVTPQAFRGISVQPDEIYILTMMAGTGYHWCENVLTSNCTIFDMIGRLRDGYNDEEARAEVSTLLPQSWVAAEEGENSGITAFPLRGVMNSDVTRASQRRFITLLTCVAGVLLLVCCVNLSGLLMARNSARTREFAIRSSLGAPRLRLIRQLITESFVLALGGGLLGTALSIGFTSGLNAMFYSVDVEGHPLFYNFDPDPRVLLTVLAVSVATGLAFGFVPAFRATRVDTAEQLKRQATAVSADSRSGRWLAGIQSGMAVALVVVSALLVMSARLVMNGANFDVSHIALMRLRPRLINYSPEKAQRYLRSVIERLDNTAGVESASTLAPGGVLVGGSAQASLVGQQDQQGITVGYIEVGARYFETLRTPVLFGREFNRSDTLGSSPVAIVSEALARRLWRAASAIGSTIVVNHTERQVIGVVADVPLQGRGEPQQPYVYTPFWQNASQMDARLCIRVRGDPVAMIPRLVQVVNRVDPAVPVAEAIPLSLRMAGSISSLRVTATFASYAAALALVLSGLGLYGALAFSVGRRSKEIGIRLAVGAERTTVFAMLIREGMTAVGFGLVIGVPLAAAASRLVRHLLYGPSAGDYPVYIAAVLIITAIGLIACLIPAQHAARLDPVIALREE